MSSAPRAIAGVNNMVRAEIGGSPHCGALANIWRTGGEQGGRRPRRFVNGKRVFGAQPLEVFRAAVDKALAAGPRP